MNNIEFPQSTIECANLSGKNWKLGSGDKIDVYSPYSGATVGFIQSSNNKDVDAAIEIANGAAKAWAKTPIKERTTIMFKFREILLRDIDKIANIVSLE